MSSSDPGLLVLLKDKEEGERDRRKSRLLETRGRLSQLQAQTEQLTAYRRHYQDHWHLQFKSGATPQVLQCYRQFVERLDAALAQQAHSIRHVSALVDQAEHALLQQEIRVAAIDKLVERRGEQALLRQRQHQQRQDDEWAQRAARSAEPARMGFGH